MKPYSSFRPARTAISLQQTRDSTFSKALERGDHSLSPDALLSVQEMTLRNGSRSARGQQYHIDALTESAKDISERHHERTITTITTTRPYQSEVSSLESLWTCSPFWVLLDHGLPQRHICTGVSIPQLGVESAPSNPVDLNATVTPHNHAHSTPTHLDSHAHGQRY